LRRLRFEEVGVDITKMVIFFLMFFFVQVDGVDMMKMVVVVFYFLFKMME